MTKTMNSRRLRKQISQKFEELKSQGYDTDSWDMNLFVEEAIEYMTETAGSIARLCYDGVKSFTISSN